MKKWYIVGIKILSIIGISILAQHSSAWQAVIKIGGDSTPSGALITGQNKVCFNGEPLDMVYDSVTGKAMIGGDFTRAGKCTGTGVPLNVSDGAVTSGFLSSGNEIVGNISATISDGGTGYYVDGEVVGYDGTKRNRVLKLDANGMVDPSFYPDIPFNKKIRALAYDGTNLFVGGEFDSMSIQRGGPVDATFGMQATNLSNTGSQFNGDVKTVIPDGFGG